MKRTSGRRWASLALGASIGATLLAGGTAAAAESTEAAVAGRANACGLYRDENAAQYKNCSNQNERIFVTYIWTSNQYYCVAPGQVKHLGSWNNVFRVYNRGTC